MTIEQFQQYHKPYQNTLLFQPFEQEPIPTDTDIKVVEDRFRRALPENYVDFCKLYGGGDFGPCPIYTLTPNSDYYIITMYESSRKFIPADLIPFSDDGTGGYYCFRLSEEVMSDNEIIFVDETGREATAYKSIFDMLIERAHL